MNNFNSNKRSSLIRFSFNRIDFSILLPSVLLVLLSFSTFYSIDPSLFEQQLIYFFIALFAFFVFLNIDLRIFSLLSKYLYVIMIVLLLGLFFIGFEAKGAIRWVEVFGVNIQFSEVIKPFFIIFLAFFLTKDDSRSFVKFIKSLVFLFPLFVLILLQPDLGNAMIYFFSTMFVLLMYGFPLRYFVGTGALLAIPTPFLFNLLHDYQKNRILSFINAKDDPFGSSYNQIQSLISIGSGGLNGKGFGESTQSILRFLPERHTDFIFATFTESLGFLGGILLIATYAFLLYRIFVIYRNLSSLTLSLIVVGFYFLFLTHIFLNIGMNIGILPIVGITLPMVSYGGSSLLTSFIMLGIISSIGFEARKRHSLEIS